MTESQVSKARPCGNRRIMGCREDVGYPRTRGRDRSAQITGRFHLRTAFQMFLTKGQGIDRILPMKVERDCTAGRRCFRRETAQWIDCIKPESTTRLATARRGRKTAW